MDRKLGIKIQALLERNTYSPLHSPQCVAVRLRWSGQASAEGEYVGDWTEYGYILKSGTNALTTLAGRTADPLQTDPCEVANI